MIEAHRQHRQPLRLVRLLEQCHTRLLRRSAALSPVAGMARRDDVVPRRDAALRARMNVIDCRLAVAERTATVLAAKSVASEEVQTGKRGLSTVELYVAQEAHYGGHLERKRDRADIPLVAVDDLDLAQKEQGNGLLPGDDLDGLEPGSEK